MAPDSPREVEFLRVSELKVESKSPGEVDFLRESDVEVESKTPEKVESKITEKAKSPQIQKLDSMIEQAVAQREKIRETLERVRSMTPKPQQQKADPFSRTFSETAQTVAVAPEYGWTQGDSEVSEPRFRKTYGDFSEPGGTRQVGAAHSRD